MQPLSAKIFFFFDEDMCTGQCLTDRKPTFHIKLFNYKIRYNNLGLNAFYGSLSMHVYKLQSSEALKQQTLTSCNHA